LAFAQHGQLKAHERRWHTPDGQYKAVRKQQRLAQILEDAGWDFKHEHTVDTSCSAETKAEGAGAGGAERESRSRRIDMLRVHQVKNASAAIVLVECDEFQHDDRDVSCEVARMTQVNEAWALEGNTLPIVWIRWNPDVFRVNGVKQRVLKRERGAQLVRFLHALEEGAVPLEPSSTTIFYLFYDRDDGVGGGFIPPKFALQKEYATLCTLMRDPAPFLRALPAARAGAGGGAQSERGKRDAAAASPHESESDSGSEDDESDEDFGERE
jgi:hypothetical protein